MSHEFQSVFGPLVAAISDFTKRVRVSDLTVLTQHHTGEIENVGNLLFETALFYSGRPLIVVPKDQSSDFSINRVLIAWDGSAHAARAVGAAMPLLEKAGEVAVLAVKEDGRSFDLGGRELVKNLCLHKITPNYRERHETDIAATVFKEVEMFRASLVVMGGYGHWRLREFVLGGVTRSMLKNMPTPSLMAH